MLFEDAAGAIAAPDGFGAGGNPRPVLAARLTGYGVVVSSTGQKISLRNQRSFSVDSEGFHG